MPNFSKFEHLKKIKGTQTTTLGGKKLYKIFYDVLKI